MFKRRKSSIVAILVLTLFCSFCFYGCGNSQASTDATATTAPTAAPVVVTATPTPVPVAIEIATPTPAPAVQAGFGIDFEDGNFSFAAVKETVANSAIVELSVADYNGSKALKVLTNDPSAASKVPYVAFDISSLAGDKIVDIRSITFDIGVEYADGAFHACSGFVYSYYGTENVEATNEWSVFAENKNPKTAVIELDDEVIYAAGVNNIIMITKETDLGLTDTGVAATFYIDNIVFYDAAGAPVAVDTAAAFVGPAGFGEADMSNLTPVKDEVFIDGFPANAAAWAQAGAITINGGGTFDPTLLKPGCILTISYKSTGSVWLVGVPMDGATFPWTRIMQQTAATNDSNTVCQITYDQIVAALGTDDFSLLYALQCESDQEWSATSVSIGYPSVELPVLTDVTVIEGFENLTAAGWAQAGINTVLNTDAPGTFDATVLKPGMAVQIEYKSAGSMWLVGVSNGNPLGNWIRIAQFQATTNDSNTVCQITYDQIIAAMGEGYTDTLMVLQCESDQEWTVYSVSYGTLPVTE